MLKAKILDWQKGWIWDCREYQRVARWIDIEAVQVWQNYTWIYFKKDVEKCKNNL